MSIKFTLVENKLPGNEGKYRAIVQPARTIGQQEVFERMLQQGSTMTMADAAAVFENAARAIASLLIEGYNVCTDLANYRTVVRGAFESRTDNFDPKHHEVVVQSSPGRRVQRAVRTEARAQRQRRAPPTPTLLSYRDVHSERVNAVVTPGGLGHLYGKLLKYDLADPEQGIFFVTDDNQATHVTQVGQNHPATLFFVVPPLPPGEYWLEVRALPYGRGKQVRAGRLMMPLTVEAAEE